MLDTNIYLGAKTYPLSTNQDLISGSASDPSKATLAHGPPMTSEIDRSNRISHCQDIWRFVVVFLYLSVISILWCTNNILAVDGPQPVRPSTSCWLRRVPRASFVRRLLNLQIVSSANRAADVGG